MDKPDLSQGVWARGWSDTKHALGAWWFWVLEVFGAGSIGVYTEDPVVVLIAVAAIAVALWIGATAGAPMRQRNEARRYIRDTRAPKVGGDVSAVGGSKYDLRVSLYNPTGKTIKNASASLEAVEPEIEDAARWIDVQRLFGMPLRPEGGRNPHVPTPTHIDIHPDDTGIFEVGRVNFVHEKKHIALSIAETNPVQDGQGRTFYTHGVDRGIHFPQGGLCTFTVVVRGEDIKPERVAFKVDVKQARVWKE